MIWRNYTDQEIYGNSASEKGKWVLCLICNNKIRIKATPRNSRIKIETFSRPTKAVALIYRLSLLFQTNSRLRLREVIF